jgi:anti-anti-sigma regulatory factor
MKAPKRKRESRKPVPATGEIENVVPMAAARPIASVVEASVPASSVELAPVVEIAKATSVEVAVAEVVPQGTVVLSSNAGLRDASTLKDSLVALLDQSTAVTIDARAVERIDTATLQLVAAFVRDRTVMKRDCVWMGAPETLIDAVRVLGLGPVLQLAVDEPGRAA